MLNKLVRALVLSCAMLATTVCYAQPESWCVRVFVDEKANEDLNYFAPEAIGSGTLISPTLVVTNWHVVKDRLNDTALQILFPDHCIANNPKVIIQSERWDLAIVEIDRTKREYARLSNKDPVLGDVVTMHGYGYGVYGSGDSKVDNAQLKPSGTNEKGWLETKGTQPRFGDSGGGVTDKNGFMVGTLWGRTDIGMMFTVQSRIRELVKKAGKELPAQYLFEVIPYDSSELVPSVTGD